MKKTTVLIATAIIAIVVVAGLAVYMLMPASTPGPTSQKLKVAFLLPGDINDAGWNYMMYTTAQKIALLPNVQIAVTEGLGQVGPQVEATMRMYAEENYSLIIGHTGQYNEPANKVSPDYPNSHFIVVMDELTSPNYPYVTAFNEPLYESAYITGIVAGLMTETNKLGGICGGEMPMHIAIANAFYLGAKSVNPNVQFKYIQTGNIWDNVDVGKENAITMAGWGADVIYGRGDGLTIGVIRGCEQADIYAIGDITDQNYLAPNTVIASSVWNMTKDIETMLNKFKAGTLVKGSLQKGGFLFGDLNVAFASWLPQNVVSNATATLNSAMSGALNITWTPSPRLWEAT